MNVKQKPPATTSVEIRNTPVSAVSVAEITSGEDLFHCIPYNCKLMAKKCIERQERLAAGFDKDSSAWCKDCVQGADVKERVGATPPAVLPLYPDRKFAPSFDKRRGPKPEQPPMKAKTKAAAPAPVVPTAEPSPEPVVVDEPAAPYVRSGLTLAKLDRGLIVWACYLSNKDPSDEMLMEYTEFFGDYGAELIGLAMAALTRLEMPALDKLEPKIAVARIAGAAQQARMLELIGKQPGLPRAALAKAAGLSYSYMTYILPPLQERNEIHRKYSRSKAAYVWLPGPRPEGDDDEACD